MDRTHTTNAQFAAFVKATGYVTSAERMREWDVIGARFAAGTPKPPESELVPVAMVFIGTYQQVPLDDYSRWWAFVPGAPALVLARRQFRSLFMLNPVRR